MLKATELKATEEEVEEIREYFEWQAPDLEVTFMQKVYSEAVQNTVPTHLSTGEPK